MTVTPTATATLTAMRFGYGLPLPLGAPDTAELILAGLGGPDLMAARWPMPGMQQVQPALAEVRRLRPASRVDATARQDYLAALEALEAQVRRGERVEFARALDATDGFRERLVQFWANHFTVVSREAPTRIMTYTLVEDAIRPNLNGRFADMFVAAELHPAMLLYLDQVGSIGPNSQMGKRRRVGLNENHARELLELHSLGANAAYSQTDVRQMAELLTGITYSPLDGLRYQKQRAEPGAEQVLGQTYEGESLEVIVQALRDIADRPETAAHLCTKLAVHFVSDTPDRQMIAQMVAAWTQNAGDLRAVYVAMLNHPAAWSAKADKVRQPIEFLVAAFRALGLDGQAIVAMEARVFKKVVMSPLQVMGQPFKRPNGPDGWPEDAGAWITPQGLASRITWAMEQPGRLVKPLPEPAAFARRVLGERASDAVIRAAMQAESQREGIGLVLASAEFNRR